MLTKSSEKGKLTESTRKVEACSWYFFCEITSELICRTHVSSRYIRMAALKHGRFCLR